MDRKIIRQIKDKHREIIKEFQTSASAYLRDYFNNLELRAELLQDKTALDLGSNMSFFDDYCKEKYNTDFIAIDIVKDYLGSKHIMGVAGDARQLPFANDTFDLVISNYSMPNMLVPSILTTHKILIEGEDRDIAMRDVLNVLREAYRVLKPKGQIRMSTFSEHERDWGRDFYIGDERRLVTAEHAHKQKLEKIKLLRETLMLFEEETKARCLYKEEKTGGLIIVTK